MKRIVFFVVLSYSLIGFSQKNKSYQKIDSIKRLINNNKEVSLKGQLMLINYYDRKLYFDSLEDALDKYKQSAIKLNKQKHISNAIFYLGLMFAKQNKLDSAMYYFKKIANGSKHRLLIRQNSISNIAQIFLLRNQKDSALVYYKKALKIAKDYHQPISILHSYLGLFLYFSNNDDFIKANKYIDSTYAYLTNNIDTLRKSKSFINNYISVSLRYGQNLFKLNDFTKAKKELLKVRDTCIKYDQIYELLHLNDYISQCYLKENKLDSAYFFIKENLDNPKMRKNNSLAFHSFEDLSMYYNNKNELDKSMIALDSAKKYVKPNSDKFFKIAFLKADLEYKMKNYKRAIRFLDSINLKKVYDLEFKKSIYQLLYKLYKEKNSKKALNYLEEYLIAHDSILDIEKFKSIYNVETKYQTKQKEAKILKLSNENLKKEAQLAHSKNIIYGVSTASLLTLGTLLFFWYRKKQQLKLLILEQTIKAEEEEKKRIGRELHDGIAGSLVRLAHDTEDKDVNLSHKLLETYNEIRKLSHQLDNSPSHGEIFLERLMEILPENKDKQTFKFKISPTNLEIDEPYGTHIYRIVQELITNNLKHAKATETSINIVYKNKNIIISYQDNGIGIDKLKKGNGLKNIEKRVIIMKGKITFNNTDKKGFGLTIEIPYKENNNEYTDN